MIDYGALPPEVNSGRMYAGAGAGPMLAAAAAWDSLADELSMTAAGMESTIVDLTSGVWRGPAAMSMAAAGLPFAAWFKATAAQAEHAASQAKAAAAAYELAFAMTVPPAVVAANRAQLMMLVATNFFGQNTPAIAATEAHYAAMWAQDAAAMYGYLGGSAAAAQLSPFTSPPQNTNPAASGAQAGAVANNVGTAANNVGNAAATFSPASAQPASPAAVAAQAVAQAGTSTAAPTVPGTSTSAPLTIKAVLDQVTKFTGYANSALGPQRLFDMVGQELNSVEDVPNAYAGARDVLADAMKAAESAATSVGTSAVPSGAGAGVPTVGLARGIQIGGLSVPPAWPSTPAVANPAAATLVSSRVAALAAGESRPGFGFPGFPGMPGAAAGATGMRFVPRYGYRHRVMTRPPHAG